MIMTKPAGIPRSGIWAKIARFVVDPKKLATRVIMIETRDRPMIPAPM
jgi:hypothetical protein